MKQYLDQSGVEYLWGRIKHNFAKLDSDGRVPASQLPSYVDDVEEYSGLSSFPKEGEAGKIYVAMDSNLTYRWSGTTYVEISPSIALGETSTTAYPGDKGKQLATALQSEISRATTAESDIRSTITAEQNRAQNSEQELNGLIEKNANDITKVSKALDDAASEITASLEAEKQSRIDADNAEKAERQSEDDAIKADLNTEVSRAKAAEQAEATARSSADDTINASLNAEVSRAKAAEAGLASSIAAETSRATAAESDLSSKIAAEKERAAGAEATITISLNNEISDRKQAVSNETTRATAAEEALDEKIDSIEIVKVDPSDSTTAASYQLHLNGKTKGATIDIAKDQSIKDIEVLDMNATLNGDGTIEAGNPAGSTALCISYILADGSYKLARLDYSKFLEEAEFADGLIVKDHKVYVNIDATSEDFLTVSSNGVKLSGVQDAIDASTASEKAARESADTELKNLINSSKDTLTDALNSEIERAKGAESTIASNLNAEVTRAKAAEGTLQTNINNEAATRKSADDAINASVTAEVARAKAAEEANATAISTETANRENADTALQTALDAHKADTSNPHNVTKAQVGLDKVDNTADADKVVASADKLTTSRKIWGQEFDGTADVSGDIALDGNIVAPGDAQLVDLGLPSGTLWMDRNVGASSPEDAGLYFAWGETTGCTAKNIGVTKKFNFDKYKFGTSLTKYNETDGLITLETTDDAVLQNVHKYSMPTKEQLQELVNGTTSTWATQNGVNGKLFTSKTNGNSIFIPAVGYGVENSRENAGSYGQLWSSSLQENSTYYAWSFLISLSDGCKSTFNRCYGLSVRGVATQAEGSSKTITLPSSSGTLALTSDVETETTRATAKEEELQSAIDSKTVKAGRFITVSDDNTVGLDENLIPATVQAGGCSFNGISDTTNEINAVYFSLTDSSTPSVQITHQTSGTVDAGASLSPESLTMQDKNKNTAIISAGGISTTNGSIKFTTNPTDSTKNIIKATQDLARISEDGTEGLFVGTTGIGITSKTTKDIIGAQYNTYHVGSDSDTTEYTAVAPLGSDNKIPAQYIDNNLIDLLSYGVEWDVTVADPACTRIGNPLLHKSLPIQSQYKGCVVKNGELQYFLDPNDWSLKADGTASVLDGTDGDVMVRTPKFYGKSGSDGDKRWVRISTIQIDASWVEIPELYVSAYRNTIYTDTDNLTKVASVVNTTANYRGGINNSSYDTYLDTDIFRTMLGKPRTNISRATMRTYAKNAGQELLCYEFYKWIFYWAYVIEYANFNSQAAFNAELTSDGYHQGGLGAGATTWNLSSWGLYNSDSPITPCGYGNAIGNCTGTLGLDIPETTVGSTTIATQTLSVPRWRGFDNPFGDIWTNLDGIVIKYNSTSGYNDVYTTTDASKFGDDASVMSVAGQGITASGYIKKFSLGETGEIIPFAVGGSESTYKCDFCYANQASGNTLRVGGHAYDGGEAGLGAFLSHLGVGNADSTVGFRSVIRA